MCRHRLVNIGGMGIISIQSLVAYGHVGNSAAMFPLQRLGRVVWPVMTVHFAHHTGYGPAPGPLLSAAQLTEVVGGMDDRGAFAQCEAVLSGYQGAEDVGEVVLDTVARVKAANPAALYCCDPVIGDVGRGVFVRPGIPPLLRDRVVPAADLLTPNHFELDHLTGRTTGTVEELLDAVGDVRERGPGTVLVTSAITTDTPPNRLDMVLVDADGAWRTRTPRFDTVLQGVGDLTAALLLAHVLDGRPSPQALARTTDAVHVVVRATVEAGAPELRLIQTQGDWADPVPTFEVERLG